MSTTQAPKLAPKVGDRYRSTVTGTTIQVVCVDGDEIYFRKMDGPSRGNVCPGTAEMQAALVESGIAEPLEPAAEADPLQIPKPRKGDRIQSRLTGVITEIIEVNGDMALLQKHSGDTRPYALLTLMNYISWGQVSLIRPITD